MNITKDVDSMCIKNPKENYKQKRIINKDGKITSDTSLCLFWTIRVQQLICSIIPWVHIMFTV